VAICVIFLLATLLGSLLLDATVRPRHRLGWTVRGLALHVALLTALFGLFLAGSGSGLVSAVLALSLMALFTTVSNAKHAMLGEPLLFSDLALILAIFRHPRFYLTAVPAKQRWGFMIGGPILVLVLAALFVPRWAPHLLGFALLATGAGSLLFLLCRPFAPGLTTEPDVDADLIRHGLIATLLLYWRRWRGEMDPPVCPPLTVDAIDSSPEIIVIVQCESFADPVELTGNGGHALPGLAAARERAWQWGDLGVSGFGAYTMRTEYGVLFGRSEVALGFRRYDPFLTAHGETSYALTARLRGYGYHSLFVHPHDMRFYGRDRLMPAIGFDQLIGEEGFDQIEPDGHRYVNDRQLGASIGALIAKADRPTLIYAVTMENHGPWDKDQLTGSLGGLGAYLKHLRSSDGMLSDLSDLLAKSGRPALLVFFGDHRPSIPGVTEPGGARHTPYVILRFSTDGQIVTGANTRVDLAPDELHHAILRCVQTGLPARTGASGRIAATDPSGACG
jgi:hypothetical protein